MMVWYSMFGRAISNLRATSRREITHRHAACKSSVGVKASPIFITYEIASIFIWNLYSGSRDVLVLEFDWARNFVAEPPVSRRAMSQQPSTILLCLEIVTGGNLMVESRHVGCDR
jgi:hypothetical protein